MPPYGQMYRCVCTDVQMADALTYMTVDGSHKGQGLQI